MMMPLPNLQGRRLDLELLSVYHLVLVGKLTVVLLVAVPVIGLVYWKPISCASAMVAGRLGWRLARHDARTSPAAAKSQFNFY